MQSQVHSLEHYAKMSSSRPKTDYSSENTVNNIRQSTCTIH